MISRHANRGDADAIRKTDRSFNDLPLALVYTKTQPTFYPHASAVPQRISSLYSKVIRIKGIAWFDGVRVRCPGRMCASHCAGLELFSQPPVPVLRRLVSMPRSTLGDVRGQ